MRVDNKITNQVPERVMKWLRDRGISDQVIRDCGISYNKEWRKIVIPIRDENNTFIFNKYRRDPEDTEGPKYSYQRGGRAVLFGARGLWKEGQVIICEGELDAMLLESKGFIAVTSTGGAYTFRQEWAEWLKDREVYICLDNDAAGRAGTLRIAGMLPHAKVMTLTGVDEKGDITDFFRNNSLDDFKILMEVAEPLPPPPPVTKVKAKKHGTDLEKAKSVPISNFIKVDPEGARNVRCPFHKDSTASFKWYKKQNRWWCFGGCGGGDVIDFVARKEGLEMPAQLNEAIRKILL